MLEYIDKVIPKDNHIYMSRYKLPESTQYKSTTTFEKVPLFLSNNKSQSILTQKALIIEITKDILKKLDNNLVNENKQDNSKILNLDKILNKNFDKYLDKVNERYGKK